MLEFSFVNFRSNMLYYFPQGSNGRKFMKLVKLVAVIGLSLLSSIVWAADPNIKPKDFVDIKTIAPEVTVEARYFGYHNFVGTKIDGYNAPKCLLAKKAAEALKNVQSELVTFGLTLRIYDCYRPQMAVDHFARWADDLKDTKTKKEFYPNVDKNNLFKDGYIAHRSGHSRGATVDLTIDGLDMGTPFDFFGPFSNTANAKLGPQARANRLLLKAVMEKHGFNNYDKEWWHYTLIKEPHPKTYYNFAVE